MKWALCQSEKGLFATTKLIETRFIFCPPGGSPKRRGKTNHAYVEDSEEDDEADGGGKEVAQASVLPWKRENADSNKPMKQSEFPSWINNKEYTQNYSPYNTVNQGNLG